MNKTWLNTSLLYLLITALLGSVLRLMGFVSLGFNYSNLLHTHSHIAFLGWVYNILFALLIYSFLSPQKQSNKIYQSLFWLTQAANIGMLLSFPIQGYGLFSIAFSTLHILTSFGFTYQFLKDASLNPDNKQRLSFKFIKAGLFFMVISSLGPFSLGPILSANGGKSDLYYNAIYFYLHFQYNGWFSFAILGLFFRMLENNTISFSVKKGNLLRGLLFISVIPSYLLSVLWTKPHVSIYIIAGVSAFIQLTALIIFLSLIADKKFEIKSKFSGWVYFLMCFSLFCFCIKVILQFFTAFHYFADLAYQIRGFTIGYLHLVFIGFVSLFLFAFLVSHKELDLNRNNKTGMTLILLGFILNELLIFMQAISTWIAKSMIGYYYSSLLFYVNLLIVAGIVLLIASRLRSN